MQMATYGKFLNSIGLRILKEQDLKQIVKEKKNYVPETMAGFQEPVFRWLKLENMFLVQNGKIK